VYVCYHIIINVDALSLMEAQVKRLLTQVKSLDSWEQSSYAKVVWFCDGTTVKSVAKLWELYATKLQYNFRLA
jgi:hypothetical protein